jgi:mannose-6-phosphate isomerase-like protein (cupin superfamily)
MQSWKNIRNWTRAEMLKRVARFSKLKGSDGGLPDSPLPECRRKLYAVIGFSPPEDNTSSAVTSPVGDDASSKPAIAISEGFNLGYCKAKPGKGPLMHNHDTNETFIAMTGRWRCEWNEGEAMEYVDLNPYEVTPGAQHPPVQPGKLVLSFVGAKENYFYHYTQCGNGSGSFDNAGMLGAASSAFSQSSNITNGNTIKIPIDPAHQVGATLYNDVYSRTWDNHQFLHEIDTAATTVSVVHTPLSQP